MGNMYFDATSFVLHPFRQKTGIERVEQELGQRFADRGAKLVWFDIAARTFRTLSSDLLELLESIDQFDLETVVQQEPTQPRNQHRLIRAAALRLSEMYPHMPRKFGFHWHTERFALRSFAAARASMLPRERLAFTQNMGLTKQSPLLRKLAIQLAGKSDWNTAIGSPVEFGRADVLLSCTVWSADAKRDLLERATTQLGLKYLHLIYDLIPIRRPEFVADTQFGVEFERFLLNTIKSAHALATISRFVAQDLEDYCEEKQLPKRRIVPVPLATQAVSATATFTPRLQPFVGQGQRFALMVGTLQPRKNHAWAHKLWEQVVDAYGDDAPALVFAGQLGWGYEEMLRNLKADSKLWNRKIFFLEAPTDGELVWLYENCMFTVLPSLYEGWGLPIGESFSFGKYCLTSNCTAIPEAAGDLGFTAPLNDSELWVAEIGKLLRNPHYLEERSRRIRDSPPGRTWDDVANDMFELCLSVT